MKGEAIVCEGAGTCVRLRRAGLCVEYDLGAGLYSIAFGAPGPTGAGTIKQAAAAFTVDGQTTTTQADFPHLWHTDTIRDALGHGLRLTVTPTLANRPAAWSLAFSLYDTLDAVVIAAAIENRSADEIELRQVRPLVTIGDGRLALGKALRTSRLLSGTWRPCDEPPVQRVAKGLDCTAPVSFVLVDTAAPAALAAGVLAPVKSLAAFRIRLAAADPPAYALDVVQGTPVGCSAASGVSIPPGATFAPEPVVLVFGASGHDVLELYAELAAKSAGVACRPAPCGWSSWPYYQGTISEIEVLRNAEVLQAALKPYGLDTILVEAGWQRGGHVSGAPWKAGEHFPHGMAWLAGRLREHGFRAGLWIRPLEVDGLRLDPSSAFTHTTLRNEVHRLVEGGGFDALKIDFLHDDAFGRDDSFLPDNGTITALEAVHATIAAIRAGLGGTRFLIGSDITPGAGVGLVDADRNADEVAPRSWRTIKEQGVRPAAARYALHGRFWTNAPGSVVVRPPLTLGQARAWASLCALAGGMIVAGDRMASLPAERIEVLRRVLPGYGTCARPIDLFEQDYPELWHLPVEAAGERWHVVGLFNWDTTPQEIRATRKRTIELNLHRLRANEAVEGLRRPRAELEKIASTNRLVREENARIETVMTGNALGGPKLDLLEPLRTLRAASRFKNIMLHFDELGLEPAQGYLVYDFWDDRFLGLHGERLKVLVRLADCVVLAIRPATGVPQLISTNRHITQGGVDLQELRWDARAHELTGASLVVENDEYAAVIYVPHEFEFMGAEADIAGVQARHVTPSTVRLTLQSLTSKPVRWKLKFDHAEPGAPESSGSTSGRR
ncbi:MAG: hypothetical protein JW889_13345 [Verrucomicrobia bacterium]|nr:hypothetical protein [Verrucomicrobiota bacterium]